MSTSNGICVEASIEFSICFVGLEMTIPFKSLLCLTQLVL